MNEKVRLARPLIGPEELAEIGRVLDSGYLSQGPKIAEFESLLADYLDLPQAVVVSSATTALHLTMELLDVGPGDEVIVPSFTFPATANVVIQQGATPVLTDIDPASFNMDVASLEEKITERTHAVMAVHLFGNPADMDAIRAVTEPRGIPVVEDAACALGAYYKGQACGTLGDVACFSFHARKIITTGEGGALVSTNDELADRARRLRQHGGDRVNNRFTFVEPGFNYRMSDIQAAVGVVQMGRLEAIIAERREQADRYMDLLDGVAGVTRPSVAEGDLHTWQTYCVMLDDSLDRDQVIQDLALEGVETTLGTYALHCEDYIQSRYGYREEDLPSAALAWRQSLALPLYPGLSMEEQERVVESMQKVVQQRGG